VSRDCDFERSLADHDHFFMSMVMSGVRRQPWSQLSDVHLNRETFVCIAVENGTSFVCAIAPDGQIIEGIGFGGQRRSLRSGDTCSCERW
jgi:hypothetical protein